ncbi:MAG: dihydroorotate dehydrogenase [Pseudomonadota bacterium]
MTASHRGTIFVEEARIVAHHSPAAEQWLLTLEAPECARRAEPGQFVHLQCDPALPMRRPLSLLRVNRDQGWVDMLYKVVGHGTRLLAQRAVGQTLSLMGPIGQPFRPDPERRRVLLLGGGVGMPPMIFLADHLRRETGWRPVVFLGSELPFPLPTRPSRLLMPGLPTDAIGTLSLLEDWGIPCRLSSAQGQPGCHAGYVTDLARHHLDTLEMPERRHVAIYACGPDPMLRAVAQLARTFDVPAQVSLEEYMACAVGGCAGCVVPVHTPQGMAMKRVCVDGPVFPAEAVYPAR